MTPPSPTLKTLARRLHRRWLRWYRGRDAVAASAHAQRPPACDVLLDEAGAAAQDRPLGCGWFDSSYELGRGLVLTEIAPDSPALPLDGWLHLQLAGWQPPAVEAAAA